MPYVQGPDIPMLSSLCDLAIQLLTFQDLRFICSRKKLVCCLRLGSRLVHKEPMSFMYSSSEWGTTTVQLDNHSLMPEFLQT